jgi:23S rRNA (uracil1939-C5)-methyltransferase
MGMIVARLGHRGDGVTETGLFAARTLPGEVIDGVAEGTRIAAPRILTPSADRVRPPCPHYKGCGGCALQHARDSFVLAWKQDIVRAALAAEGLDAMFHPPHISPARSRRRATLAGRRTKAGALVGFHGRASDTLQPVPDCHLLHPDLMALLPALETITMIGATRKGALSLGITRSEDGADVQVRGGKPLTPALHQDLAACAQTHGLARLTWEDEVIALRASPRHAMGRALVVPPPGAFLQATREGEAALVAAVRAGVAGSARIADLFAGCGTFALPLAEEAEVLAVEGDAAMLAALDAGWRAAPGLRRVTTQARDLFRRPLLVTELSGFDAIVIDPPRAGAQAQIAQIARADVPVVAHVSCNPATFARDARTLVSAGFRLEWVQVVDQFRWSPHVELAARFTR